MHEVLANEIAAEASNDEVDQEYLDAKKAVESTFKIHEKDGEGVVKLESKYKGETIEVTFKAVIARESKLSGSGSRIKVRKTRVYINPKTLLDIRQVRSSTILPALSGFLSLTPSNLMLSAVTQA